MVDVADVGRSIRANMNAKYGAPRPSQAADGTLTTEQLAHMSPAEILEYLYHGQASARTLGIFFLYSQDIETRLNRQNKRRRTINKPRSFHDGKPCIRCNRLCFTANERGQEIKIPRQHPYGRCPLYCNLCGGVSCQDPDKHLIYDCEICETDYCNHPTRECSFEEGEI